MENGFEELNRRTGKVTKALPGINFQIDIEKDGFPVLTLRDIPIKSPIAEQVWFLQGSKDPKFLQQYTKIWDSFLEDDGMLDTAYGYRWRKEFGRDQINEILGLLRIDPSSRQAVCITWNPSNDGLLSWTKKNLPCPYSFVINIIGGRLHLHNIVRSNDSILGMPFDVFGFALLQCILAQELGIKPGIYTHSVSNCHIYENHFEAANQLIKREDITPHQLQIACKIRNQVYLHRIDSDKSFYKEGEYQDYLDTAEWFD